MGARGESLVRAKGREVKLKGLQVNTLWSSKVARGESLVKLKKGRKGESLVVLKKGRGAISARHAAAERLPRAAAAQTQIGGHTQKYTASRSALRAHVYPAPTP